MILSSVDHFSFYIKSNNIPNGCLADTSFLYALAYDDDRLHKSAIGLFDLLEENRIPIYINVISRVEFIDLIFRKQLALGAISLYEKLSPFVENKSLFNLLKNIRDQDTLYKRKNQSFKMSEHQFKKLRREIEKFSSVYEWKNFCDLCFGQKLYNEWFILEQELGLNFIEVLEGKSSDKLNYQTWFKSWRNKVCVDLMQ